MSAPLVVNTRDGMCWTRRMVTSSGIALYAPAGVCSCPEFVMATEAELAELGIVGSADVLPVPVGPRMPEFPPPPATEVEKLHAERARLQGLLAEAVADAHRARRERDEMRERVSEPYGCAHCGIAKRSHGRRWTTGVGMHAWEAPSQGQIAERMKARRTVRLASRVKTLARLRARVDEVERAYTFDTAELKRRIDELLAERHVTNEALDDAVQARRADRDRIAELEQGPVLPWAHAMSDHDLSGFLGDLVSAAMGRWQSSPEVPDREVLAAVEKVCARWKTPGEGSRLDGSEFDGVTVRIVPVQALRDEDPNHLRHSYRLGRDLPEPDGGA